jgi:hypothetical protein
MWYLKKERRLFLPQRFLILNKKRAANPATPYKLPLMAFQILIRLYFI